MTIEGHIFLNIDYKKVENEFNIFMMENEIKKDQVVELSFENNIIFLAFENNRESLQQLNRGIDSTKNTPTYIASGCE